MHGSFPSHIHANPPIGGPAHSASITRAKMPRLALSQSALQVAHTPWPPGDLSFRRPFRGNSSSDGLLHTARSAPKFSGAYTERLAERDMRRPLAFDMRDFSSSRGSTAFSNTMERVRTAPALSDFRMSDVMSVSATSLEKTADLDNWPSTNSAGSNSWLRRLEHFLEVRLQMATDGETKLLAFHECFAQFGELFKGYRPLLSQIHKAYDEHISGGKAATLRVIQIEAELFHLQEQAREEVRKSAIRVTEQLEGMQQSVTNSEAEKSEALILLADARKQLAEAAIEVAYRKKLNDEIHEESRAFCSGYRWILKNVVKTEEPNDMDALESVTLIQKLEKAQAESHSQQQQIRYFTSAAEVVYVQNMLEAERKAYAVEVEHVSTELENMRSIEGDCRKALDASEARRKVLEVEMKTVKERLDNTFMLHLGNSPDIPQFMRTAHPLINRGVERDDVLDIIRTCIRLSLQKYDGGEYPELKEIFAEAIMLKYTSHTVAEWGRNVLEALEFYRDDYDCNLFGSILATTAGSHLLIHRARTTEEAAKLLSALVLRLPPPTTSEDVEKNEEKVQETEAVAVMDLLKELPTVFPHKTSEQIQALVDVLRTQPFANHIIDIAAIARGQPTAPDSLFLDILNKQTIEEALQYASEMRRVWIDMLYVHTCCQCVAVCFCVLLCAFVYTKHTYVHTQSTHICIHTTHKRSQLAQLRCTSHTLALKIGVRVCACTRVHVHVYTCM